MWALAIDVRDPSKRGFNSETDYVVFHYSGAEAMELL